MLWDTKEHLPDCLCLHARLHVAANTDISGTRDTDTCKTQNDMYHLPV